MRGADAVVRMLEEFGVEVVFGLCGDTSLPLYEALSESEKIRHVLTRDERSASFMADAYARLSGRVGVCEGPSGGGATYILPGVAEANDSSVPVVCVTTDISVVDRGKGTLTELDQPALFAPVAKRTFGPEAAAQLPEMLRGAFTEATTGSLGACHLSLPLDVQDQEVDARDVHGEARFGSYPQDRREADSGEIKAAARYLANSHRPLIVAGAGVIRSGAWDEVKALSRMLGAAVATSICGKGSIAETDPFALGVIGSNGGLQWRHDLVRSADLVFCVGSGTGSVTTERWTLPAPGAVTILQLDTNAASIGRNYAVAAGIHADAKLGLSALVEEVGRLGADSAGDRWDPAKIERHRAEHADAAADLFAPNQSPIRPERLMRELFAALPKRSVVLADPGTPCPRLGRTDEAVRLIEAVSSAELGESNPMLNSLSAIVYAVEGDGAAAEWKVQIALAGRASFAHAHHIEYNVGVAYALLGQYDNAVEWLRQAAVNGFPCLPYYERGDFLRDLRSHPEFRELLDWLRAEEDRLRAEI